MKNYTILLCALIPFLINAQKRLDIEIPYNEELKKYIYQEVVEINNSDSLLYSNAIQWISNEFGIRDFPINDKFEKITNEFSIEIPYTFNGGMGVKLPMKYTILMDLTLEFKTNRYRYSITNFKISQNEKATTPEASLEAFVGSYYELGIGKRKAGKMIEEICSKINAKTKAWIEMMKVGVQSKRETDDEW